MELYADTNILVRLLTKDDPDQFRHIAQMLDSGSYQMIITSPVIIELCWVLKSNYGFSNEVIGQAVIEVSEVDNVRFEEEFMRMVLLVYIEKKNIDIVDIYLSVKSKFNKTAVVTFDKDFKKLDCEFYKPNQL